MKGMKIGANLKTTGNARKQIGSVSQKLGATPGLPGLGGKHEASGVKKLGRKSMKGSC